MVQTFATNSSNNDIYLGTDGNLAIATGLEGVLQACQTASYAQLGEMVLATELGMPNFQTIWIGSPNYALWNNYLIANLQNVEGVTQVDNVQITKTGNTLNYIATISTEYGVSTLSGSLTQG